MVTEINHPGKIGEAIYYSEQKIGEGTAECIYAGNFLKEAADLTLAEKKERFDDQSALNKWVKVNALHISINFAPDDVLDRDKLIAITQDYLEGIGFKDQPYLVYQHRDAAHPHLHVVTTNIRDNGDTINLHFFRRRKSEPARKAVEEKYGLVKAGGRKPLQQDPKRAQPAQAVQYGKHPTLQAITDVLNYVLHRYHYRDLAELNAILRLYNVRADPGKPGGRIHSHGGLLYKVLDARGKDIGVPIKASAIYFNPGLKWLEQKFQVNQQIDSSITWRLRYVIDQAIRRHPANWTGFAKCLQPEQVAAVPYLNKQGQMYGLFFVDFETKTAIQASELGSQYSSNVILGRLGFDTSRQQQLSSALEQARHQSEVLDILFRQEALDLRQPDELTQKANRDKKRRRSNYKNY